MPVKKAAFSCLVLLLLVLLYGGSYLAMTKSLIYGSPIAYSSVHRLRTMRGPVPVWFWRPAAAVEAWITDESIVLLD